MTTATRPDLSYKTTTHAIDEKLLAHPEIAKHIDNLETTTTAANNLVRSTLQTAMTRD